MRRTVQEMKYVQ